LRIALAGLGLFACGAGALACGPATAAPHVEVVAQHLHVPWALAFATDGRLFFTEEVSGRLKVLAPGGEPGVVVEFPRPPDAVSVLRGLALDPDFLHNGWFYVHYTHPESTRLARFTLREGAATDERVLLNRLPMAMTNFGGRLKFGPDGMLYLTTGYANDFDLPQDPGSLAGKILRVDPTGGWSVYSLGHRNVQGLAWHPESGRLFATEHGPTGERGLCCNDEVNLIVPGGNYGWPVRAGSKLPMGSGLVTPLDPALLPPVLESGEETWAPSGADFYRGPWVAWKGSLFFAALRGQALHRVVFTGPDFTEVELHERLLAGEYGRLRDVASGPEGCLYVATSNRDGRSGAQPAPQDDRILRVCPRTPRGKLGPSPSR